MRSGGAAKAVVPRHRHHDNADLRIRRTVRLPDWHDQPKGNFEGISAGPRTLRWWGGQTCPPARSRHSQESRKVRWSLPPGPTRKFLDRPHLGHRAVYEVPSTDRSTRWYALAHSKYTCKAGRDGGATGPIAAGFRGSSSRRSSPKSASIMPPRCFARATEPDPTKSGQEAFANKDLSLRSDEDRVRWIRPATHRKLSPCSHRHDLPPGHRSGDVGAWSGARESKAPAAARSSALELRRDRRVEGRALDGPWLR